MILSVQKKINLGYATQSPKGAGIRLYEYASKETIKECRLQLEAIFWLCVDSVEAMINNGMSHKDAKLRKMLVLEEAKQRKLLDFEQLRSKRIINSQNHTICPLCLRELSGEEFLNRLANPRGEKSLILQLHKLICSILKNLNMELLIIVNIILAGDAISVMLL